jgi:hypothetical protein
VKGRIARYVPIIFLTVAAFALLFSQRGDRLERKRARELKALSHCLSQVRTPLDFQPLYGPAKRKMESLTTFLTKEVMVQGRDFASDAMTAELESHIMRIYAMPGGKTWLEKVQRQALLQLHEAEEKRQRR